MTGPFDGFTVPKCDAESAVFLLPASFLKFPGTIYFVSEVVYLRVQLLLVRLMSSLVIFIWVVDLGVVVRIILRYGFLYRSTFVR